MQNSMFIRVHKRILNYTTTNIVHNAHIMKFCGENAWASVSLQVDGSTFKC